MYMYQVTHIFTYICIWVCEYMVCVCVCVCIYGKFPLSWLDVDAAVADKMEDVRCVLAQSIKSYEQ